MNAYLEKLSVPLNAHFTNMATDHKAFPVLEELVFIYPATLQRRSYLGEPCGTNKPSDIPHFPLLSMFLRFATRALVLACVYCVLCAEKREVGSRNSLRCPHLHHIWTFVNASILLFIRCLTSAVPWYALCPSWMKLTYVQYLESWQCISWSTNRLPSRGPKSSCLYSKKVATSGLPYRKEFIQSISAHAVPSRYRLISHLHFVLVNEFFL